MRLSEKTIELNVCSQLTQYLRGRIIWFGLTQRQEARAGFDAAIKLGGRLILFQFKASNYTLRRTLARRFYLEHQQLTALITRAADYGRSVFYVFPMIGNTVELRRYAGDFVSNTWLLDVSTLQNPFPGPTTRWRTVRRNNMHYADVTPPTVTIHSKPIEAELQNLKQAAKLIKESDGLNKLLFPDGAFSEKALKILEPIGAHAKMAILI
jgi:hypothetical protein